MKQTIKNEFLSHLEVINLTIETMQEKLEQAQRETFESEGAIDSKTLEKFEKLYSNEMEKLNGEFFTATDLSDETLNLTDEKQGESQ